jgi:hypothetical protein
MSVSPRSAIGIATIWVATVAGVSATAWIAVDRAGRDIADAGVSSVTSQSLVTTTSNTKTPGSEPSPSVTIGTPTATSLTPADRSFSVAGGQLSVRCSGPAISLRIAQPSNGWRVEVGKSDAQGVNLIFEKGGEEGELETRVKAFCQNGTPALNVTTLTKPQSETGEDD